MIVRLQHWRNRKGLTLQQLGEKAGVSYVTISRIENGRLSPTVTLLVKLAAALNIEVRDFFPTKHQSQRDRGKRR